jgi:FKBP-type peptidyl-prolyl cis-trans isomerase
VTRGVDIELDEPGAGKFAQRGKTVVVRLKGSLHRGDVFLDGSIETITLGARDVIPGLEYGIEGMCVGGRRRIRVHPHLGYREQGVEGKIPPNALLFFELELLDVRDFTAAT